MDFANVARKILGKIFRAFLNFFFNIQYTYLLRWKMEQMKRPYAAGIYVYIFKKMKYTFSEKSKMYFLQAWNLCFTQKCPTKN